MDGIRHGNDLVLEPDNSKDSNEIDGNIAENKDHGKHQSRSNKKGEKKADNCNDV